MIRLDARMTAAFAALSVATHLLAERLDVVYAIVCSLLFAAGIGLFLLGFWNGVQRSRVDDVTLAGLLAVSAGHVDRRARNHLWGLVAVQTLVATVAAVLRPFTMQTFGLLVPMFGLGLATLWGSRNAVFHPRDDPRRPARDAANSSD